MTRTITRRFRRAAHAGRRRGASLTLVLLLALSASGCHWGTRLKDFPPANGPQGATVSFRLRGGEGIRKGELFAADSAGLMVLAPRLVRVSWHRLEWVGVEGLGGAYEARENGGSTAAVNRLAPVSRFPQGLSGPLLARVLVSLQQPALEEIQ